MRKPAITLIFVAALALTACGTGGYSEAKKEGISRSDYRALCKTWAGEWGNATSDKFMELPAANKNRIKSIIAEDPSCQEKK